MSLVAQTIINASAEKVWETLLDKVFHPDQYVPDVVDFEWKERAENEYVRTIYTESDDVVELITIDEAALQIHSSLVRHICMKGVLVQRVEETTEGTLLIFEQDREITLPELQGLDMQPALDAALEQIKEKAEALV